MPPFSIWQEGEIQSVDCKSKCTFLEIYLDCKMKRILRVLIIPALCYLVCCGRSAVVNGGNQTDFEKSHSELTAKMSMDEKERFDAQADY